MAKKPSPKSRKKTDDVVDAEVVKEEESLEPQPEEVDEAATSTPEEPDLTGSEEVEAGSEETETPEPGNEPIAPPTSEPQVVEVRRGGTIPMVIGGLVAGAIGYGIATYFPLLSNDDQTVELAALQTEISNLKDQVAGLPAPNDIAPLTDEVSGLASTVEAAQSETAAAFTALTERVEVIEKQPSGDGTLQEAAIAAYERDIQALRDQLADQQAAMEDMMSAAEAQLQATQDEAQAIEEQTIAAARAATARSAIARIQTALDSGASYGAVLAELEQVSDEPLPESLVAGKDGVATVSALSDAFPDAARSALSVARAEGASGEDSSGFTAFLKNQFSVRSVEPKDGTSADAVLSRAEAAVNSGRINDALAEISSLPEVARAELSDWVAEAERRAAAVDAANSLFSKYNVN